MEATTYNIVDTNDKQEWTKATTLHYSTSQWLHTRECIAHVHTLRALRQKVLDPLKQIAQNTICLLFLAQLLLTDAIKSLSVVYIADCDRVSVV